MKSETKIKVGIFVPKLYAPTMNTHSGWHNLDIPISELSPEQIEELRLFRYRNQRTANHIWPLAKIYLGEFIPVGPSPCESLCMLPTIKDGVSLKTLKTFLDSWLAYKRTEVAAANTRLENEVRHYEQNLTIEQNGITLINPDTDKYPQLQSQVQKAREKCGKLPPPFKRPTYDEILAKLEGKIVRQHEIGEYRGDWYILFQNKRRWGFLVFGWGSCSGCDALQDCRSQSDVIALIRELREKTQWFNTRKQLVAFLKTHDWDGDACANRIERASLIKSWIALLTHA